MASGGLGGWLPGYITGCERPGGGTLPGAAQQPIGVLGRPARRAGA